MFFIASKVFWFVAEPVSLAIVVGVLGILLGFTRFARAGRALMAGAIIALAAGLLTPFGTLGGAISVATRRYFPAGRNYRPWRRLGHGKIGSAWADILQSGWCPNDGRR
jgi:xanthosine utilization system XapX-like protein